MKICYVHGGNNVPSVRFRLPMFKQMRQRRHEVTLMESNPSRYEYYRWMGWRASELMRRTVRRWQLSQIEEENFAAVVLESEIFHTRDGSFEERLRAVSGRLVYELDDALFLLFPEKIQSICQMADRVIAGNQKIADWALQYNQCVKVIPTCIDADDYTEKKHQSTPADTPVVGWIGSAGNIKMLSVCAAALRQVAAQNKFRLHVISADRLALDSINLKGVDVRWIDIDRCDVVAELQKLDIGIMPLPADDPWMEYKCNAKMIQYMAVGVPAIGSALGFNLELVDHGVNSLLAADHEEWVESLSTLLESPELRVDIGRAGRKMVMKSYTVQSRVEEYERAVLGSKFQPEKHDWSRAC